jgi:hypothetical protein
LSWEIPLDNISASLVELLLGIGENMEMAEAGQRHGLKHAPLVACNIQIHTVVPITAFKISSLIVSLILFR